MRIKTVTNCAVAAFAAIASSCVGSADTTAALNRQAADEYVVPVRPGGDGRPFWNVNAKRFVYAPVFDIPLTPGAQS